MKKRLLYYGIWTAGLLLTEIIIGTWLNDWHFVRAYMGDVLVIPLIYCLIRIFTEKLPRLMPFLVCCIGFIAEGLQYIRFYELLGFEKGSLMAIILGTGFTWWDMLCYVAGMVLIYAGIWLRNIISMNKKVN